MAQSSVRPDPDRDRRARSHSVVGRSRRGGWTRDVVWFPAGEKHWHGAAPTEAMTHLAIQEHLDGETADWMEKVSDDQYTAETVACKEHKDE